MSEQAQRNAARATAVSINVLVVIDTEYVKANYQTPSKDPKAPTGINHNSQFMIATGTRGIIGGQGTADLSFRANAGDFVQFVGTSVYANSDDAVIVHGIKHWNGVEVFNKFQANEVTRSKAAQPTPGTESGLPATLGPINFLSLDSKVARSGTENFYVYFALYTLTADGQTQTPYGYFYWDPTIVVG